MKSLLICVLFGAITGAYAKTVTYNPIENNRVYLKTHAPSIYAELETRGVLEVTLERMGDIQIEKRYSPTELTNFETSFQEDKSLFEHIQRELLPPKKELAFKDKLELTKQQGTTSQTGKEIIFAGPSVASVNLSNNEIGYKQYVGNTVPGITHNSKGLVSLTLDKSVETPEYQFEPTKLTRLLNEMEEKKLAAFLSKMPIDTMELKSAEEGSLSLQFDTKGEHATLGYLYLPENTNYKLKLTSKKMGELQCERGELEVGAGAGIALSTRTIIGAAIVPSIKGTLEIDHAQFKMKEKMLGGKLINTILHDVFNKSSIAFRGKAIGDLNISEGDLQGEGELEFKLTHDKVKNKVIVSYKYTRASNSGLILRQCDRREHALVIEDRNRRKSGEIYGDFEHGTVGAKVNFHFSTREK